MSRLSFTNLASISGDLFRALLNRGESYYLTNDLLIMAVVRMRIGKGKNAMTNNLMRTSLTLTLMLLFVTASDAFGQHRFNDPSAFFRIRPRHSMKCLRVADGGLHNGAPVIQDDCTEVGDSQKWQILPAEDGYFKIVAKHSRKVLDVLGGMFMLGDGDDAGQWDYLGGTNQMWQFIDAGNGDFFIIARHSGKALDIDAGVGATRNGARAQQWANWGGPNQKFLVERADVIPDASLPAAQGRFRVTLTGFRVNHATSENIFSIDGAGDEVFAVFNLSELRSSTVFSETLRRGQSLFYGDSSARNDFSTVHAGSASNTGGLLTGEPYPRPGEQAATRPSAPGRLIPMVLREGELRRGGSHPNATVIIPTIWENDNLPEVLNAWQRQVDDYLSCVSAESERFITGPARRPLVTQGDIVLSTTPRRIDFDRPIGMDGDTFSPFSFTPRPATFIPAVMFLTFTSAQEAVSSNANSSIQARGVVEITYRDGRNFGPGSYTIYLLVERL